MGMFNSFLYVYDKSTYYYDTLTDHITRGTKKEKSPFNNYAKHKLKYS